MLTIILINMLKAISALSDIYLFFMFCYAILNLLGVFGIINLFEEGIMSRIYFVLRLIIDPLRNYINRFLPRFGAIDLGFLVLIMIMWIVSDIANYYIGILQANTFYF